jgi:hypothetical protein
LQPKGRRVEEAVEEPDATVLIVADGPVAQTGQGSSARSEDASRANHACGAESTPGSWAVVRSVQHHDACPQPNGQIAKSWVQRVADPSAAMQQLKENIVLVPFAEWPQHPGQPVAQSPEPAEPVEPSREIAMPSDPPGGCERGTDSPLGLPAGCGRIAGLAAGCSHQVPPWWHQRVADPEENLLGLGTFRSSHLAAHAPWESPPGLADGIDLDSDGRQRPGDRR